MQQMQMQHQSQTYLVTFKTFLIFFIFARL